MIKGLFKAIKNVLKPIFDLGKMFGIDIYKKCKYLDSTIKHNQAIDRDFEKFHKRHMKHQNQLRKEVL